ncbi:MAG: GNAT family N-acetyltransferase [Phycisphaerales bacterium]|nr:GNAT family N-acetyltransferase [Phycisphaerales bacterium]
MDPHGIPGLRPIRREDEPAVISLIDRCYRQYGLILNLDDECEQHLRDPGAYFRSHGGDFWVVDDGAGGIMGTAALYVHSDRQPALGELKSMYVDPARRRQGLGSRLTRMVMARARAAGCRDMELWSDTRFDAAHAMYESLGFRRIGRRDLADSNNSAEFGFRRALDPG